MLYFAQPWGLLALASLGAVLFLYFFVFRGRRIEVSSLHLWQAARSLRLEGRQKRRPPVTLPLALELLSALLLALLVAGLTWSRQDTLKHLVVVLDSSASMNAEAPGGSFRDRAVEQVLRYFDELGDDGRVTLVASGFEPRVLGRESLRREQAAGELARWRPSGPTHPITPAVELALAMSEEDAPPIVLTDHPGPVEGARVVAVGEPLQNTGWVSCHWTGPGELFALVRHFGEGGPVKKVTVTGDGVPLAERELDLSRGAVPLAVEVPPEVRSVRLELAPDALENDNALVTARPLYTPVPVAVDVEDDALARYLRRAVEAAERAAAEAGRPALVFTDRPGPAPEGAFVVRFRRPEQGAARPYAGPFALDPFHPFTRGMDLRGTIWAADPTFEAGGRDVLMSAGEVPLAVLDGRALTLNLEPGASNVFTAPAWPVFVANVVEHVYEQSPGLKRLSYRLGEVLAFARPAGWKGRLSVEAPDGSRVAFEGERIYYGRLEREGVWRVLCDGRRVAAFDVNLLSEAESDLTGAASAGGAEPARPAELMRRAGRRFHREFGLLVAGMLLGCWYVLERRAA